MPKDKAYTWIVFLMLLLVGLMGCSSAETPATVVVREPPAAEPASSNTDSVAPPVLISDTVSPAIVKAAPGDPAVSVETVNVPGSNAVSEDVAPADAPAGMANPASVYCQQQGGRVQIRSTDAGEIGMCVFSDGQECEEWAFSRGECTMTAPAPGTSGRPSTAPQSVPDNSQTFSAGDWIGTIGSLDGGQFDDYFETVNQSLRAGIDGQTDDIDAQLIALRDTGITVHIWGVWQPDVPDAYSTQILVTRLETIPAETETE